MNIPGKKVIQYYAAYQQKMEFEFHNSKILSEKTIINEIGMNIIIEITIAFWYNYPTYFKSPEPYACDAIVSNPLPRP